MVNAEAVRERILTHAVTAASAHGLKSLSIGEMAREFAVPKSRLFTLFPSSGALQLAVLEHAAAKFGKEVIEAVPESMAAGSRVPALFARWLDWSRSPRLTHGCPFVHASSEGDDLPEPVRRKLTDVLDHWSGVLRAAVDGAKRDGALGKEIDADQLVFELYGLYLSHHFWHWSMRDQNARTRTMKALDRLLKSAQQG
ncbi:MAG: TetR/AcrR family transcriptional regulator [Hyphomicrobiaceae bacterium]|nr:TetR/AcrR family transcriptional regulator [Hyphomicrobiaceae bacterium]